MQKMHERFFQIDRFVPFAAEYVPVKNSLTKIFPHLDEKMLGSLRKPYILLQRSNEEVGRTNKRK